MSNGFVMLITNNDVVSANNVCVIDETSAVTLFGTSDVVGMDIDVTLYGYTRSFRIVGVSKVEDGDFFSMSYGSDIITLEIPYTTADAIIGYTRDEFEAVYGKALPPSQRDKSQPLTILNTLEDAEDGKWGGRLVRLLRKLLGTESMAGAIALQTPIKNFISMSFSIFSPAMAEGLLVILNEDKMAKGLGMIFKGLPNALKNLGKLKQI